MITSAGAFADYFEGVPHRTRHFVGAVPPERADWAPRPGEYTCGDIVRHLAACETMFVGAVVDGTWRYPGHERETAPTLPLALAYLDDGHAQAIAQLRTLADGALHETPPPLA